MGECSLATALAVRTQLLVALSNAAPSVWTRVNVIQQTNALTVALAQPSQLSVTALSLGAAQTASAATALAIPSVFSVAGASVRVAPACLPD